MHLDTLLGPSANKPAPTKPETVPSLGGRIAELRSLSMWYKSKPSLRATTSVRVASSATMDAICSSFASAPYLETSSRFNDSCVGVGLFLKSYLIKQNCQVRKHDIRINGLLMAWFSLCLCGNYSCNWHYF